MARPAAARQNSAGGNPGARFVLNITWVGRAVALILLIIAMVSMPPWKNPVRPKPAPRGFGVAIGYGLGGERELDQLGPVWYFDYNHQGKVLGSHLRFFFANVDADLTTVRATALAQRGEWWQFGNEPNDPNQDNVSPAEYALRYHAFYFLLKTVDPSAQVVSAGIADADWRWADAFREAYRAQYGRYPPLDGWNIHNYLLDSCEAAMDVNAFKKRIVAFREWMARIGDAHKPLFLTEYGVLYGNGCCGCPRFPEAQVAEYMQTTTQWLSKTPWVQGWAWFALRTGGRYNGDLFTDDSAFTFSGETYHDLIEAEVSQGDRH